MDNLLLKYDCVFIKDLIVSMSIGIYDHEKSAAQDVILNIKIYIEKQMITGKHTIDDVVSYEEIVKNIKIVCTYKHFDLVEELAEEISKICLQDYLAYATYVQVEKPDIISETKSVGVQIFRQKTN